MWNRLDNFVARAGKHGNQSWWGVVRDIGGCSNKSVVSYPLVCVWADGVEGRIALGQHPLVYVRDGAEDRIYTAIATTTLCAG